MTDSQAAPAPSLESRIVQLLVGVAPDIEPASIRRELDFRDQFDFDSMDLFNFAAAIHQSLGVDVPERDYRNLMSLDKCAAYLRDKVP
jgi:acyl carrier protein